jgi:hypothetical protein
MGDHESAQHRFGALYRNCTHLGDEQEELSLSVIRKLLSLRAARAVVTNPVEAALAVPELISMRCLVHCAASTPVGCG